MQKRRASPPARISSTANSRGLYPASSADSPFTVSSIEFAELPENTGRGGPTITRPPSTAEGQPLTRTLLCQFGEFWNNNLPSFPRDVGHLFTGKDLDGSTVGLGWIGVICAGNFSNCNASGSSHSYSLVQSRFSTTLALRVQDSAHELGHNWNACHCNTGGNCAGGTSNPNTCGIMTSGISGGSTFDAVALNAITAWRDNANCLDAWQNPSYVDWSYNGVSTGSPSQPWNTIGAGVYAALVGGEVRVTAGLYLENLTIHKALTISAENSAVTIGVP
jgi:hypothetical protein